MSKTILFGASGFIGQHLIRERPNTCLAVTRNVHDGRYWLEADLLKPQSIEQVLNSSTTVINLAYSEQSSVEDNIQMAENLVQACLKINVLRLVHCSTAIIVGNNSSPVVNEDTPCYPETVYEKTKYAIERVLLDAASSGLRIYILRPTGVIGSGGQNLKKMLFEIQTENPIVNFLRSSLYGARPLNLVPVKDVVRALLYLSEQSFLSSGIYICSADDDFDNYYNRIEKLMRELLVKRPRIKPIGVPTSYLNALLRISRKGSGRFVNRYYSSEKLFATGFRRSVSIHDAVKEFVLSEFS